jgi:hypothetical protein
MPQVLAREFVAVRQQRKQLKPGSTTATAAAAGDNTLPAESISLLRHAFILIAGEYRVSVSAIRPSHQGSQAPLGDFDQLVEGPWPISTTCPPRGPPGAGKCIWAENWSKQPPFRAQNFDHLVEDPSTIPEVSGLRPVNFDRSTSLRALPLTRALEW